MERSKVVWTTVSKEAQSTAVQLDLDRSDRLHRLTLLRRLVAERIGEVVDCESDAVPLDVAGCIVDATSVPVGELTELLDRVWPVATLWLTQSYEVEQDLLRLVPDQHDCGLITSEGETLLFRLQRAQSRALQGRLQALAHTDPLTGLMNRRGLSRAIRERIELHVLGDCAAFVMLDLDGFKRINDTYGHAAGDAVLVEVACRVKQVLSSDDAFGRLGGDEFGLIVQRTTALELVEQAQRIIDAVAASPVRFENQDINVTASAGLALVRNDLTQPQLVRQADNAVYAAKHQGRNRLVHFEMIHDRPDAGPEADLERFQEVTRMIGDQMNRMVTAVGKRLVESTRTQAQFDALTRARNRGYFNERLPLEIQRARNGERPLAIALLDIDHFHDINMTYTWTTGDAVLQKFVQVVNSHLRETDWLARYGGEEFAIVLPGADLADAQSIAERIRSAVAMTEFNALDGRVVPVTISVGVTCLTDGSINPVELCTRAGAACLRAKNSGRNRVVMEN